MLQKELTTEQLTEREIHELVKRMVETTAEGQNKGKGMKRLRTASETFGTILNASKFELQGSLRKKKKRKELRIFLKKLQLKTSTTWERKQSGSKKSTVPYRLSPRRNTSRHLLIKLTNSKDKERMLKISREKQQVTYKGKLIHLTADISSETLQEWQDIF